MKLNTYRQCIEGQLAIGERYVFARERNLEKTLSNGLMRASGIARLQRYDLQCTAHTRIVRISIWSPGRKFSENEDPLADRLFTLHHGEG
jgi:hypothetical protein